VKARPRWTVVVTVRVRRPMTGPHLPKADNFPYRP
jgi:hypothetical protein